MGNCSHSRIVNVRLSATRLASRVSISGVNSQFWMFWTFRSHTKWIRQMSSPPFSSAKLLSFQPKRFSPCCCCCCGLLLFISLNDSFCQFKSSRIFVVSNNVATITITIKIRSFLIVRFNLSFYKVGFKSEILVNEVLILFKF